jgi:regulator of sirC expression with transglutaminase-like and TPR domain
LLRIAEAVIQVDPDSAAAYRAAGLAASQIYGLRSAEARRYYQKYVELNPNPEETAFVRELFPDL